MTLPRIFFCKQQRSFSWTAFAEGLAALHSMRQRANCPANIQLQENPNIFRLPRLFLLLTDV